MDTIVVFGSVTSATYQHLRLAMMRKGLKPKIVRFDQAQEYENFSSFLGAADDRMHELYGFGCDNAEDDPQVDALLDKTMETLAQEYFAQVFSSDDEVNAVKALIFPSIDEFGDSTQWEWVIERFPRGYAEYTVQKSEEDDSFWLSGHGFGDSLPCIEVLD